MYSYCNALCHEWARKNINSVREWYERKWRMANKIAILLAMYLLYFTIVRFLTFNLDGTRHSNGDDYNIQNHYIPKSQRHTQCWRIFQYILQSLSWIWVGFKCNGFWSRHPDRTDIERSIRYRQRKRQRFDSFRSPRQRWKKKKLFAFWAVAMASTSGANGQKMAIFDTDSATIGVDNRCSACISSVLDDFDGPVEDTNRVIKGFGGSKTANVMKGTLVWKWYDDNGTTHDFRIPNSYYVKMEERTRLLSPQHLSRELRAQARGKMWETTDATKCIIHWDNGKSCLTIPLDRLTNVATFRLAPGYDKFLAFCAAAQIPLYEEESRDPTTHDILLSESAWISDDDDEGDDNPPTTDDDPSLTIGKQMFQPDGSLTDWCRPVTTQFDLDGPISHVIPDEEERVQEGETNSMKLLKVHQRMGHVSFRRLQVMAKLGLIPKELQSCPIPVCSACLYGKQTRRRWRSRQPAHQQSNQRTNLQPGDVVSVDQLVSPVPGIVAQATGRPTLLRYKYATVYVDHASKLGYIHLQSSADAKETLVGKTLFEKYALDSGVTIKRYHADNGIFKAHAWVEDCRNKGQGLTFAGVNAHHQNGVAEKRIRDIQELARTQMIFAKRRWPDAIDAPLWPYALRMANQILNETPLPSDTTHRSATQIFTSSVVDHNPKHYRTFGCPVYVLNEPLQHAGGILGKWSDRSKVGVYLGQSPKYNRNVALVLSLTTGLVSPQFHVEFDDTFQTVKQEQDRWKSLWQLRTGVAPPPNLQTRGEITQGTMSMSPQNDNRQHKRRRRSDDGAPDNNQTNGSELSQASTPISRRQREPEEAPREDRVDHDPQQPEYHTRSGRSVKPNSRYSTNLYAQEATEADDDDPGQVQWDGLRIEHDHSDPTELMCHKAVSDPDTLYHHQAMKEPDADKFREAMVKEVQDQLTNGNFTILLRSKLPKGATVLPAVWQMKRKRDIRTRAIKKYKARLNIDGSRMKPGKHYDPNHTYAPVASWNSIRLLLIMTAVHGWTTRQIDFVLAFPQAPVERDIYMKIPAGFEVDGNDKDYVLQLHRNVYGQKQAGRVWNEYLHEKLLQIGFIQSKYDECVYFRGRVMYVLYTDDSILAGPNATEVDQAITDIQKAGLNITVEGDLQDFLGVNITKNDDGTITLTQPHLIDQILEDLGLTDDRTTTKSTPAKSSAILRKHSKSKDFDGHFNYRSVIGKLNYLERGSRPDIAYIVHQCARFTACPKYEHGAALKWLGRYLKGTRDKGMILRPQRDKDMEVYVDADFVGNWSKEEGADPDTARSRHGYIIMYAGVPVSWKSQLQGEICLSSTESEYTGLSHALRETIPIMEMLKEMRLLKFPVRSSTPRIHCQVFEDNSGALEMAKIHKYRPRTKHICTKLHHFRDYVTRGEISIHPIDTHDQPADFLTKPLNEDLLVRHRRTVMGW